LVEKKKTIYDIAREAGVSVSTVSRVLNGHSVVREQTAQKVRALIEKYGFSPSAVARNLSNKRSSLIGCILPDITNPFYSSLFSDLERWTTYHDYVLFLANTLNDFRLESKYLSIFQERQVEGVFWAGGRINEVTVNPGYVEEVQTFSEHTPIVMINGHLKGISCHSVEANEVDGVYKLVELLASEGHRNIGYLGGVRGITSYEAKIRAFKKKMKELHLPVKSSWIIPGSFDVESGILGFQGLLAAKTLPSAVLCVNDLVAIGTVAAANREGMQVPEDLSVCGFDDIPLSRHFFPDLTTVNQNYYELARSAMRMMLQLQDGKKTPPRVVVETLLSVRNSTKRNPFSS